MNAGDIVTSKLVTARPETGVSMLARQPLDNKISAMPVVDNQGCFVEIISEGDLLGRPSERSPPGSGLRLFNDEAVCSGGAGESASSEGGGPHDAPCHIRIGWGADRSRSDFVASTQVETRTNSP